MRKRKLYHLLELMTKEERDRFSLFLDSPYHNSSKTLILFWTQWRTKVFDKPGKVELSEAEFVKGSSLKLSRMDAMCWELMVKARKFLSLERSARAPALDILSLSKWLTEADPGLARSERFLHQLQTEVEDLPESPEKLLVRFLFQANWSLAEIYARKPNKNWVGRFIELQGFLRDFYQTKSYQLGCGALNARQVFRQKGAPDELAFWKEGLTQADDSKKEGIEALFGNTLSLLEGKAGLEVMLKVLSEVEIQKETLNGEIREEILAYMLNFGIRKVNQGDEVFLRGTFELFRQLFLHGDLMHKGQIHPQHFKNVIALACRLGELTWTRAFILEYRDHLSQLDEGLALQYNQAVLHFHEGDYRAAIAGLRKIINSKSDDVFYGLDARMYLWKSYFEHLGELRVDEVDEMFRLYDSFRLYVKRNNKISATHQEQYSNFIWFFKRLLACLEKSDPERRKNALLQLQHKLESSDGLSNKTWFAQKLKAALEDAQVGEKVRQYKTGPPPEGGPV